MKLIQLLMEDIVGISIRPIEKDKAESFVLNKHYLKRWPTNIYNIYGIFLKNDIIGIVIYGKPMSEEQLLKKFEIPPQASEKVPSGILMTNGNLVELKRLYIDDVNIKNLESYVISRSNKILCEDRPMTKIIISYADQMVGHVGTIYKATNAIYMGMNKQGKHLFAYPTMGKYHNNILRNYLSEKQ